MALLMKRIRDPFSGLSHGVGFLAAVGGAIVLGLSTRKDLGTVVTVCVYSATLIALYAASATYHLVQASEKMAPWLRRMDHCAIFLFIAGSCTPIFYNAFEGTRRVVMLSVVWVIAVLGLGSRILWLNAPRWLYTSMYVAMGWLVIVQRSAFFSGISREALGLVIAGGLTYTLGAVVYALKRPNFMNGRIGFHEIWHIFVMGGSALHFAAVYLLVHR